MPGIIALKRSTNAATQTEGTNMQAEPRKAKCAYCQTDFAQGEGAVVNGDKIYHKGCAQKIMRRDRVREIFVQHADQVGLTVQPRHHF